MQAYNSGRSEHPQINDNLKNGANLLKFKTKTPVRDTLSRGYNRNDSLTLLNKNNNEMVRNNSAFRKSLKQRRKSQRSKSITTSKTPKVEEIGIGEVER